MLTGRGCVSGEIATDSILKHDDDMTKNHPIERQVSNLGRESDRLCGSDAEAVGPF